MAKSIYGIMRKNTDEEKADLDKDTKATINLAALYIYHFLAVIRWKLQDLLVIYSINDDFYYVHENHSSSF